MMLLREMTTVRSVNNSIVFQNISTIAGRHHCIILDINYISELLV